MPLYESTFIARQDISNADVDKIADAMEAVVKDGGGKVVKREYWGLRSLSYRINKSRKGHYLMLGIDAPADAVKELDRKMSIHEDIIRRMTIRVEKISEDPSAILQSGKDTKGRGDRDDFFE
jgi:small subunit ribosomal protein S6